MIVECIQVMFAAVGAGFLVALFLVPIIFTWKFMHAIFD